MDLTDLSCFGRIEWYITNITDYWTTQCSTRCMNVTRVAYDRTAQGLLWKNFPLTPLRINPICGELGDCKSAIAQVFHGA